MQEISVHRSQSLSYIYATIVGVLGLLTLYDYFFRTGARSTTYLLLASALIVLIAIQWWTRHRLTINAQGLRLARASLLPWAMIESVEITKPQAEQRGWLRLKVALHEQERTKELLLVQNRIDTDLAAVIPCLATLCEQHNKPLKQAIL
jgi:uncharacterized membrane protein YobD (UPF0266 family)